MSKTVSDLPSTKTLVTIETLAAIFRVSRSTVKNWRSRQIIQPCVAIGSVVRFDLAECERQLAEFNRNAPRSRKRKASIDEKPSSSSNC